jgi:hypothetical protein
MIAYMQIIALVLQPHRSIKIGNLGQNAFNNLIQRIGGNWLAYSVGKS